MFQSGPRPIWNILEAAHHVFRGAGWPGPERYSITLDEHAQHVWLDYPGGPSWTLGSPLP
ncbi:hypothetical protein [Streptomyces violascens]|uniref:hypothetical protein n=1 Tax=Streptomyces violascens TaxID=67381 RepID=UPI0036A43910